MIPRQRQAEIESAARLGKIVVASVIVLEREIPAVACFVVDRTQRPIHVEVRHSKFDLCNLLVGGVHILGTRERIETREEAAIYRKIHLARRIENKKASISAQ